jgi:membrane-associated phospholipid phosphatase
MSVQVAWSFGPAIHAIRDEGARYITRELMVPFVSFPSYHAVAAVLLSWAAWPIKKLRWPILLLNLCMSFSALIIGAHYLVDLIGGAVIAVVSIALATRMLEAVRDCD